MADTFGKKAFKFYNSLKFKHKLPAGVAVMNPYEIPATKRYVKLFFEKFFNDRRERILAFGINPGRFGAGITGITFTDPVALEKFCGIANDLPKRREPSTIFIYDFIQRWGGPKKFYRDFYLTAVSPLGFRKDGRNYNFYDDPALPLAAKPFIVKSIEAHFDFGARRDVAIVIGTGKVREFLEKLNSEHKFFKKIYAVEHPRFIMQYRRRKLPYYLKKYRRTFAQAINNRI